MMCTLMSVCNALMYVIVNTQNLSVQNVIFAAEIVVYRE